MSASRTGDSAHRAPPLVVLASVNMHYVKRGVHNPGMVAAANPLFDWPRQLNVLPLKRRPYLYRALPAERGGTRPRAGDRKSVV